MDIVAIILIVVLVGLLVAWGLMMVQEAYRHKKHKTWFDYFNKATKNSFYIGGRLRDETDTINKCIAAMQEAFKKGELTEETFRGVMRVYTDDYIKAVYQFKQDTITLEIEEDLRAADKYAKEHNWKYGILYDD